MSRFGWRGRLHYEWILDFLFVPLSRKPRRLVVCGQPLAWQIHFSERRLLIRNTKLRPTLLHFLLTCNPDSHSPLGFECQRGNPAWRLFWYCWTLSWKTFLTQRQGCSGFRTTGLNTSTDHSSKAAWRAQDVLFFTLFGGGNLKNSFQKVARKPFSWSLGNF